MSTPSDFRPLRPAAAAAAALLLAVCLSEGARADERVPPVADADLPVAGTCAPVGTGAATHVRVGRPDESGWFAVEGVPGVLDGRGLEEVLAQRAQAPATGPSFHSVWITAGAGHKWEHVVRVILACMKCRIFRVGLRVRHESAPGVFVFPLFLPGALEGVAVPEGTARGLEVRVGTALAAVGGSGEPERSDPLRLHAAALRASRHFPERVVASVRIAHNASLGYAVRCLDLLYRGGVAAVKLRLPMLKGSLKVPVREWISVQGVVLDPGAIGLDLVPVSPRAEPWSDTGADVPGVALMPVEDLPEGEQARTGSRDPKPPFRRFGAGPVPAFDFEKSGAVVVAHAQGLGPALRSGLSGGPDALPFFVERLRTPAEHGRVLAPARETFPDATRVTPSTLQVDALLFAGGRHVATVDATVYLGGAQTAFVSVRRSDRAPQETTARSPEPEDPWRSGVPGALRQWFEGAFARAREGGAAAVPLAPVADVLAQFPPVAHAGVKATLARRDAEVAALLVQLGAVAYDRVDLRVGAGTAAVWAGERVGGILNLGFEVEDEELRVSSLVPRRAPP